MQCLYKRKVTRCFLKMSTNQNLISDVSRPELVNNNGGQNIQNYHSMFLIDLKL